MKYQQLFLGPVAFAGEDIEQARKGNYKPASERLKKLVGDLNRSASAARVPTGRSALKKTTSS